MEWHFTFFKNEKKLNWSYESQELYTYSYYTLVKDLRKNKHNTFLKEQRKQKLKKLK